MDRGTRRAQKARIRTRLRQILAEEIHEDEQKDFAYGLRPITQVGINQLRRHVYRNGGKRYNPRWVYTYTRCDCGICEDNRRYRTLRETERMEQDWRGWWKFGVGEGEED